LRKRSPSRVRGGTPGRTATRREVLSVAAGTLAAAPLMPGAFAALEAAAQRFFSASELALVDELTELIIPTDEHSPGARAAGVAAYIDARLAETTDTAAQRLWRSGLAAVEALSHSMHGKPFLKSPVAERIALLEGLSAKEQSPSTDPERFFAELKRQTVRIYYTSKIGLHQEMEYKGNTILQEFVGIDVSKEK
jgi:hypothetical protein